MGGVVLYFGGIFTVLTLCLYDVFIRTISSNHAKCKSYRIGSVASEVAYELLSSTDGGVHIGSNSGRLIVAFVRHDDVIGGSVDIMYAQLTRYGLFRMIESF